MPTAFRARQNSRCSLCDMEINRGDLITRWQEGTVGWAHLVCAELRRSKAMIEAGETFRSHKPSTWRRR